MPTQLAPGSTFAGYRLDREIGRGGMGVVYRAIDLQLERLVALKLIAPELASDESFRKRFLKESRLAASLGHPHILPVYAAGEADGQLYLAMRYVEGEDLKTLLAREGALAPERALAVAGQVAEALDAAHEKGLVHRDVKPGNVLLDERLQAYLSDFGLTKQVGGASTQTGQLVGTLDYLAPEQIRGEDLDGRTDEYALACVLYECLAGTPPFRRPTEAEVLWAHMQEHAPRLHDFPQLDPVLEQALGKGKEERYGSCGEFVNAAWEALGLETPRLRRRRRQIRRSRMLLMAGALVLAGAVAGLVVTFTTGGGAPPEPVGDVVAAIGPETGRVSEYTEVGTSPSNVVVGEDSVWVLNADDQTITRIDLRTGGILKTFGTGGIPTDLAFGEGSLWVGNGAPTPEGTIGRVYTRSVSRVDPRSTLVTRKLPLPKRVSPYNARVLGVSQLAVDRGSLWAINPDETVSHFDAATGALLARVRVVAVFAIAAGKEGVWVTGPNSTVTRIDPRTNKVVRTIRLSASSVVGITVGGGSIWASDPIDGLVWRIEPGGATKPTPISVGAGATNLAFGNGAIWVANFEDGTVSSIDLGSNRITKKVPFPGTPQGVAVGAGSTWVTVASGAKAEALPASACGRVDSGGARPDVLIASDLPLQGPQGATTRSMAAAVDYVVRQHGFRAGKYTVGYQSCDDSTAQSGGADYFKCASNAKAFAQHSRLVGLVGPYNSDCATVEVPIANRAGSAPLAMVSPANTMMGLTRRGPGAARDEPGRYYPTGTRNYVRLVTPDDVHGAADAVLARRLGLRRVFVLRTDASGNYSIGQTSGFVRAALRIGVGIAGSALWNPKARSYDSLADRVARSRADGVFLGDSVFLNGGRVVRALRARLGPKVTLIGGDGFSYIPDLRKAAGRAAVGMYTSFAGVPNDRLHPAGRRFLRAFGATQPGGTVESETYVPQAAQAAEVLLQAVARSDGTRSSVLRELWRVHVKEGIVGSFGFDRNGDATPSAVTIFRVASGRGDPDLAPDFRGAVVDRVIRVPTSLLHA